MLLQGLHRLVDERRPRLAKILLPLLSLLVLLLLLFIFLLRRQQTPFFILGIRHDAPVLVAAAAAAVQLQLRLVLDGQNGFLEGLPDPPKGAQLPLYPLFRGVDVGLCLRLDGARRDALGAALAHGGRGLVERHVDRGGGLVPQEAVLVHVVPHASVVVELVCFRCATGSGHLSDPYDFRVADLPFCSPRALEHVLVTVVEIGAEG